MDLGEFEEYLFGLNLSEKTRKNTLYQIKTLLQFNEILNEKNFKYFIVNEFKKEKPISAAMANKYIQTARHWCAFSKQDWAKNLKQYKEKPRLVRILSNEEIERFLAVPRREDQAEEQYKKWQLFWSLCIFTGCRFKEIRTLKTSQIDIGQEVLLLPKTKSRPRTPSLTFNLIPMLEEYMRTLEGEYLFPMKNNLRKPMTPTPYERDYHYRIKYIGINRGVIPYDLRHTAITRWLKQLKMNIYDAMKQAGHSSPETTEKYYQFGPQYEITNQLNVDPILLQDNPDKEFNDIVQEIQGRKLNPKYFSFVITEESIFIKRKL